jgi:ABC-type antimicrobial peptide transport system permease subunit
VAGQLYGVKPYDPVVLVSVVATLSLVGFVACIMPARRATRLDPAMVLRDE